jgi:hypothetical protein
MVYESYLGKYSFNTDAAEDNVNKFEGGSLETKGVQLDSRTTKVTSRTSSQVQQEVNVKVNGHWKGMTADTRVFDAPSCGDLRQDVTIVGQICAEHLLEQPVAEKNVLNGIVVAIVVVLFLLAQGRLWGQFLD